MREINGKYEGFIAELVNEIAQKEGFNYTFISSIDNRYGIEDVSSGIWNGLVGMLLRREIDCIAADLTVTAARLSVLEFSEPFMSSSIKFLLKDSPHSQFSLSSWFLSFSPGVWILILVSYAVCGFALCIIIRISPYEKTRVTLTDTYWYLAFYAPRICRHCPRSISSRLLSCCWWMFYLCCLCTYFIFVSGHLSAEAWGVTKRYWSVPAVLDNVDTIGVVSAGSTLQMLQKSENPVHAAILRKISDNPESLVDNYIGGLDLVEKNDGAAAMLMEETAAQYVVAQDCSKYTVGNLEDRHYAFAFNIDSKYTSLFSEAVLRLSESGKLSFFRDSWWPQLDTCHHVPSPGANVVAPPLPITLTLHQMATPFIFLVVALILALLISCFEIATDKTITNKQKYLRQRFGYNQTRGEDTCVTNAATQTILWASSRCGTPAPGRDIPSFCTVSTNAL